MDHFLSYASRLQLVKFILGSMQNYLAQIFPLLKKLIKDVETICRRFRLTGSTNSSRKAHVAWSYIQHPKAGGGLNVVDMVLWN